LLELVNAIGLLKEFDRAVQLDIEPIFIRRSNGY
jgi:hypothetical protein